MINSVLNMIFNYGIFSGLIHKSNWRWLRAESCVLRERGLSHGTWSNKVSHLNAYISFTTYFGVEDFPLSLGTLLRFIALLGRGSLAYKSATNILGSLKFFTSLLDPPSVELFEYVVVKDALKGLKAQLSRPVRQKLPFSINHLLKFYINLDLSVEKQLATWCAMLMAFFGCFRLSNLVPSAISKFDPLKHLKRDDIRFESDIVLIFYKWSKTNQNCNKVSWIPICPAADARFNLKFHLEALFNMVDAPASAPLFSFRKENFHSRHSLVNMLEKSLSDVGLSPSDYSWHSFRRGAAVFAFELGLADSAVQLLGDWSSSAFKNYLEFAFLRKVSVAESVTKSFNLYVSKM